MAQFQKLKDSSAAWLCDTPSASKVSKPFPRDLGNTRVMAKAKLGVGAGPARRILLSDGSKRGVVARASRPRLPSRRPAPRSAPSYRDSPPPGRGREPTVKTVAPRPFARGGRHA